jgi:hypothetical protein
MHAGENHTQKSVELALPFDLILGFQAHQCTAMQLTKTGYHFPPAARLVLLLMCTLGCILLLLLLLLLGAKQIELIDSKH